MTSRGENKTSGERDGGGDGIAGGRDGDEEPGCIGEVIFLLGDGDLTRTGGGEDGGKNGTGRTV